MQQHDTVTIGEAAKQCNISAESIRHYERIGLLPNPTRGDNGYRYYSADALDMLATIRAWREIGMSLEEIRALGPATADGTMQCAEVEQKLRAHAEDVRERIIALQALEARLRILAEQCDADAVTCPVIRLMSAQGQVA